MKSFLYKLIVLLTAVFCSFYTKAQDGMGSTTVDNSTVVIASGTTEQRFSEGSYFGPNAEWIINGVLEIYSKNIWIAPGAKFSGTGKIVIYNPGDNPFYVNMPAGSTYIDGNNAEFIKLLIEHRNDNNVILANINDPGYSTTNPAGALSAKLNIGADLNLAVNGGNIILNDHDLQFDAIGKPLNYGPRRMIVTSNSIKGHVVKDYAAAGKFEFPIGIAENDYTPATVETKTAGQVFASVQDYAATNLPGIRPELGMDRNWHLFASSPLNADVTLQHNAATNGNLFKDATAGIAQYNGNSKWDIARSNSSLPGLHTRYAMNIPDNSLVNEAWFTKYAVSGASVNVPNLFTPNGDGVNDAFAIIGLDIFPMNDIVIVNRWGNEVFKQTNYKNTWTGEGLNEGTYYYRLRVKENINSEWTVISGWVMLTRKFRN